MLLTTQDRFFNIFPENKKGASDAGFNLALDMRIRSVSHGVEKYIRRSIETISRVNRFTPETGLGTKQIRLSAFPIVSITSLTIFGDSYTEDEYYTVDNESGVISFQNHIFRTTPLYENAIVVTYVGGMAIDTAEFDLNYPDIESEVLTQIQFELTRIKTIALKSESNGASSSQLNDYGFMKSLTDCLDRYRKEMWA